MEIDGKIDEMNHLQALITAEEEKEKSFKAENIRRRHNYIPFIVELLKVLAKEGRLVALVQEVFLYLVHCLFMFYLSFCSMSVDENLMQEYFCTLILNSGFLLEFVKFST